MFYYGTILNGLFNGEQVPNVPVRIPPDPEKMNDKRARAAEQALLAFAQDIGETDENDELHLLEEQNMADLLADLAHYCDREGLNIQRCIAIASYHYAEETDHYGLQLSVSD